MAREWFVPANIERLNLSDGEWIEVKKELNYGEQADITERFGVELETDAETGEAKVKGKDISPLQQAIVLITSYVVDWSVQVNGRPEKIAETTVRRMKFDYVMEISGAINDHIAKMEEEKKALTPSAQSEPSKESEAN